nr:uncharacterized oxidoreductase SERP2049-like [Nerophis lumbriciformis]
MNYVEGKVVVITGGASGFGRLVAQRVTGLGGHAVVADVDEAGLAETVELGSDSPGSISAVTADVTDLDQMRALALAAVDAHGAIDVVVNNAGIMPLAMYADHEVASDAWSRCVDINFKGVLHGIIAVYDQMIEQGSGHVINISSIYGNYPVAGAAVYGATKAAVNVLSDSLRQETQGRIKVTTVRPTGVPATNLGSGVINPEAAIGILGHNMGEYMEQMGSLMGGDAPPEHLASPDSIGYLALSPEILADNIVLAMNQPLGVSISDLTVRASGDRYII